MKLAKKFFEEVTFFGGIVFYLFLIFLLYITGKPDYSIKLSLVFIFALIIIYSLTFVIRLFYFKQRPEKIKYSNFIEKIDASSFPSVHAARITFLALFFMFSFTMNYLYIPVILVIWFFTIYSRYYLKKHDTTDLITGIILGIISFVLSGFILT